MTARRSTAWRLARRLAAAHKVQSVLLCAAVAVPVAIGVAASTVLASATPSSQAFAREVAGDADALVHPSGWAPGDPVGTLLEEGAALRTALPAGSVVVLDVDVPSAVLSGPSATAGVHGRLTELAHTLQRPRLEVTSGDLAILGEGGIALTTALADFLDVRLGDQVLLEGAARPLVVGAVVRHPRDLSAHFFALPLPPGDGMPGGLATDVGGARWLVGLPPGMEAAAVWQRLEVAGHRVESRAALEAAAPPRPDADPAAVAVGAILLVEVALFAGAAFALQFRRLYRQLGLLGCMGASRRFRRRCLRAYCMLFGVLGGIAGALLGWLAAVPLVRILSARAAEVWSAPVPPAPAVAALAGTAIFAALAAGVVPARSATRQPPLELLRSSGIEKRRLPAGFALGCAGATAGAAGAMARLSAVPSEPLVVVLVAVLGLVASLGLATVVVARHRSRFGLLPPAGRVASRSLFAAPLRAWLVSCGVAAIIGAAAAVVLPLQSAVTNSLASHVEDAPLGTALVAMPRALTGVERSLLAAELDAEVAHFSYAAVTTDEGPQQARVLTPFLRCVHDVADIRAAMEVCEERTGQRNYRGWLGLAEEADLAVLLRRPLDGGELERYRDGAVALVTAAVERSDRAAVAFRSMEQLELRYPTVIELDAFMAADIGDAVEVPVGFLHPQAAARLGLTTFVPETGPGEGLSRRPSSIAFLAPRGDGLLDTRVVRQALPAEVSPNSSILVERGPWLSTSLPQVLRVVVAVTVTTSAGAILVAIALWLTSLHGDFLMLGAIGASRRWRRRTGACSGFLLAAVPTLLALAWGGAAGWVFTRGHGVPVVFPWGTYAALGILVLAVGPVLGSRIVPGRARPLRQPV